ncbi:sarcoplasmic calcium-binding protein, alpha chain isoform X2 [Condylostylus longicornis]|uniref:sarcoplasmic calcium-binding protein, alpha chain isoform X2 n=1 Tax=Condylostylus longicornis TaxID=2530218 RepID=UPI00244DCC5C|nr:sarcoplasmic calcium-binding protein, alpha chain isoform X2 [Condylostylus longicornis]
MAYEWGNRVNFVVKYMYDIDNNGFLDQKDFECMAVRACVIEGKGDCSASRLSQYQHVMRSLWDEISELADFDKDGKITTEEFKDAVKRTCMGKKYDEFPQAMKAFIEATFKMIDLNGDGVLSNEEFRYNCITRIVVDDVTSIDEAYKNLLNDDDRKKGGLTLARYKELYAQYLGNPEDKHQAIYLFGPLDA